MNVLRLLLSLLQDGAIYLRGQMMRIKKTRPIAVRIVRATRKVWRKDNQVIDVWGRTCESTGAGKQGQMIIKITVIPYG